MRVYAEGGLPLILWVEVQGQPLPQSCGPLHSGGWTRHAKLGSPCLLCLVPPPGGLFPPLSLLGPVSGDSEGWAPGTEPHGGLPRFNKLAVGSVVESAFRRLKHLQVLDIEGNFEFGDVSKDRGRLEEEEEEDEENEEDEDEEEEKRR